MADLFLSSARRDRAHAERIAAAAAAEGRSVTWEHGSDAARERKIAAASQVVVAWSAAARDSLWVRAEANEALDQHKFVQIDLDGARPPRPFTALDRIDFRGWNGARDEAPWQALAGALDGEARRPAPVLAGRESPMQGFGRIAAIGWAALGIAIGVTLSVLLVARRLITAETFGWISIGAAVGAALLLAAATWFLVKVSVATRR